MANPSVETVNPSNASLPQSWAQGGWGTNTRAFSYPTGGAHSGNRFTRVALTSRSSGDAKWYFPHVAVQPNTSYTFRDWYRSNVTTQLVAEYRSTNGTITYTTPVNLAPSTGWVQASWVFVTPAGTASVTIYHVIAAVGSLDTDDTSLALTDGYTANHDHHANHHANNHAADHAADHHAGSDDHDAARHPARGVPQFR